MFTGKRKIFIYSALLLVLCVTYVSAQRIIAGKSNSRGFDQLSINYSISSEYAEVDVAFYIDTVFVGEELLTWEDCSTEIDYIYNTIHATGIVWVDFEHSNKLSSLNAQTLVTEKNEQVSNFKGALATWQAPNNLIYIEKNKDISPELRTVTSVTGENLSTVTIKIYSINDLLYSLTLMQTCPEGIINNELILGSTQLTNGTKFHLTPPSSLQKGQVLMQCEFKSSNIPLTKFSSSIANWELYPEKNKDISSRNKTLENLE